MRRFITRGVSVAWRVLRVAVYFAVVAAILGLFAARTVFGAAKDAALEVVLIDAYPRCLVRSSILPGVQARASHAYDVSSAGAHAAVSWQLAGWSAAMVSGARVMTPTAPVAEDALSA